MKEIIIKYNQYNDETTIELPLGFRDMKKIHQVDALHDAINILTKLHKSKVDEYKDGMVEGDKLYPSKKCRKLITTYKLTEK